MSDTPESSYGPTAALLWTLPPFRDSLFKHLSPAQSTQALTWSRPSYAQALKAEYGVIRMMRYRRYQPRFSDPRRSILFHASPRVLDCRDYVPVLNDPELLSYYLTLFPNVTEIFDNSYRLTFIRHGAGFEDVRLEILRKGLAVRSLEGVGKGEEPEIFLPGGLALGWALEIVTRSSVV